jgi:glutathione peroxidase
MSSATTFYDFKPVDKKGQAVPLSDYKGKVVLVVNTASKCGFTPQFEGLEKLYKGKHHPHYTAYKLLRSSRCSITDVKVSHPDFEIIGFPCNQFGGQDPGSNDDIQSFCQVNYGVTFPVLGKTDVNGEKAEPVWEWMKKSKPGLLGLQRIKWNFEKFLIGRDGLVKGRWASTTSPDKLASAIEAELKKPAA